VLGKDGDGMVNEVGKAVVKRDGNGTGLSKRPIKWDDRNACLGEEVHVAAKSCRRHGDDRARVVDGVVSEDGGSAGLNCGLDRGLDHDFSVG